jgi:uncharacterized protein (TIGR03437 family)
LDRLRTYIIAAVALALMCTAPAMAQNPPVAQLQIVAGNGQVTCQGCFPTSGQVGFQFFLPMVVRALDAQGNPIGGQEIDWTVVTSNGPFPNFATQTFTDGAGYATNFLSGAYQPGSVSYPFIQTVLNASAGGLTATFTETQGLTLPGGQTNTQTQLIFAAVQSPGSGTVFTGTTGAPAAQKITVHVDAFGTPVPNASVRLLNNNDPAKAASASCATGAGADPGSVLTDSTGSAVCTVIFGPIAGTGSFTVIVGGVDPAGAPNYIIIPAGQAFAYYQSGNFSLNVTPGVPGQIQISSGNNQNVNAGQAAQPLSVLVTDSAGTNPIAGQSVTWTVSPAGAATVSPATSTTNSSGIASTVVTLSPNAVGTVSVKAALTGNLSNITTNFTISVNVQVTGIQKVSGDAQSAPANTTFGQPLVVQVNASNGQPARSVPVSFTINGPGTLSSPTANTDSNGRAQVVVNAGNTAGAITVTASTGAFSTSFSLTVIPPGPNLQSGTISNGADFQRNAISPCSIATLVASGLAPGVQGVISGAGIVGPYLYTVGKDTVTVNNSQAPIYSLSNINGQEQLTFQLPCDVTPGSNIPLTVNVGGGTATTNITVLPASPGIFSTLMTDNVSRAVIVRPDGTFVSLQNPARKGDVVRLYATGLGPVTPSVTTNSMPAPTVDSLVNGTLIVGVNNAGARVISGRLAPTLIGVYEVTFQIPTDAPTGNDVVLSLAVNVPGDSTTRFSAGNKIVIQ